MPRIRHLSALLLLSLLALGVAAQSGCSVLLDFTECTASTDCAAGICQEGICQTQVACNSRATCADYAPGAYCLANTCRVIDTARCTAYSSVFQDDADGSIVPIGGLLPLSGTNQDKGEAAADGAELALRQINANGGSRAGKFGLIVCDTQYAPDVAVANARYLHDELGVESMIGAISSAETLAVVDQVTDPAQILIISPASTSPGLSRRSDTFWRTIASDALQGPAMAALIADRGFKSVAVLYGGDSDPYGSGFFSALNFSWSQDNASPPDDLRVGTFNTRAPAESLGKVNEEVRLSDTMMPLNAIVLIGSLATIELMVAIESAYISQYPKDQGARPTWILSEAMRDRTLLERPELAPTFSRIIGTSPLRTQTPIYANYATLLQSSFGRNANDYQFPDKAYDAAFLIALAHAAQPEQTSPTTGAQLSNMLKLIAPAKATRYNLLGNEFTRIAGALRDGQRVDLVGVSGELSFDDNHDVTDATVSTWYISAPSGSPPKFVQN